MKFFIITLFLIVGAIADDGVLKRSKRFLFGKEKERLHIKIIEKPVYIDRPIIKHVDRPVYIEKQVPISEPVYIPKPYPVEVEKKVPYIVEKKVEIPVEKPVPYYVTPPVQYTSSYYQSQPQVIQQSPPTQTIQRELVTDISSYGYSTSGGNARTYNYHSTLGNGGRNSYYGYTGEIFVNQYGQLCDRNGVPLQYNYK